MTHSELVERAIRWLASEDCVAIITEVGTWATRETPDAIGWKAQSRGHSISCSFLVECKVSRSDFKRDAKKVSRQNNQLSTQGSTQGIGRYRYYMAPPGMISPDELPEGWGLLEPRGKYIRIVRYARWNHDIDRDAETAVLISALRRVGSNSEKGVSVRTYTIPTKNRATLGVKPLKGE